MPNLAKIIAANNNKVLSKDKRFEQQLPGNSNCNCRGGNESCPMEGAMCKDTNLLYQATVVEPGKPDATYAGISAPSWKIRYGNHTHSFRHSGKRGNTIMHQPELASINQHDDFYTACRHKEAKLLDKT